MSSSSTIHWYREASGQVLKRILYFQDGGSTATKESEFSRRFNGGKKDRTFTLTISTATDSDAGMYYCALWEGDTQLMISCSQRAKTQHFLPVTPTSQANKNHMIHN